MQHSFIHLQRNTVHNIILQHSISPRPPTLLLGFVCILQTVTSSLHASRCRLNTLWHTYIHTYSFITQNDRTHLHKIKIQVKNTNKARE